MKMQRSKASRLASSQSADSEQSGDRPVPDLSILRKSIQTSITGFTQARDVFDTGTEELKQLLTTECDVIYECKVCRNLFRSLANFISHKRVYCRQKFNTSLHAHFIHSNFIKDDMLAILQNEKDYQNYLSNKDNPKPAEDEVAKKPLRKKKLMTKDLTSIIERLAQSKEDVTSNDESDACGLIHQRISNLQTMSASKQAVYQNVGPDKNTTMDSIQHEVAELDHMISSTVAVLGPDGKIVTKVTPTTLPDPNPNSVIQISDEEDDPSADKAMNIICKICQIKFSTLKTLKFHMKHKHADNRLVYPCPDCADTFSNSWSVFRHLINVHRKSAANVRKLRDTIQNKAFRTSANLETAKTPTPVVESLTDQQRLDQENQAWMDNFEGDEIPRCGGCGRRFERRAALSSHRQTCQLRIAAQNKINSNIQRRNLAKSSSKESETAQTLSTPQETSPRSKAPKVDLKSEKKIEIKIRRDYHKSAAASPSKVLTESNEEDSAQLRLSEESLSGEGENGNSLHFDNLITNHRRNSKDCDISSIIPAMKDSDDVYVIVSTEVISSGALDEEGDIVSTEDAAKITDVNGLQGNSNIIDDSELNLEDIKRICNVNDIEPSDQTEDLDDRLNDNKSDDQPSKISHSDADKNQDNNLRITRHVKISSKADVMANFTKTRDNIELQNNKSLVTQIVKFSKTHKKLHCKKCNLNFSFAKSFRKHMCRHLDWKRFKCKDCGFKCFDKSQCIAHYKCHHKIETAIQKFNSSDASLKDARIPVVQNAAKKVSPEKISIIVELSDEETADSADLAPVMNTLLKPLNDSTFKESIPSDIILELSDDDTLINTIDSSSLRGRKRRKPKKFQQEVFKKKIKLKEEIDSSMKDISAISPKQEKRSGNSVDLQKLINKDKDLPPSISVVCKTADKSDSASAITQIATESDLKNIKKVDKSITSSMSYTVRRPVRNRVKPLNKDFEYDLSNLMKLEAEAYKESHTPAAVSQKQQLKRKQFLQKETVPSDRPTESGGIKDRPVTPKPPILPVVPSKSCHGALQEASRLAALRGNAQMKDHQLVHAYRDPQPFIQSLQRRHTAAKDYQKTTLMKSLSEPTLTTSPQSTTTKTPQTKTSTMKTVSRPSTASTTSERSSSDRTPTKAGTLSSAATRQSCPATIARSQEKTKISIKAVKKPLWKIKSIELNQDDDPNNCIKSSKISLRKISILRDDTVHPKTSKRNSNVRDDSNSENISSINNSPTSNEKNHSSDSDDSETLVSECRVPPIDNDVAFKRETENSDSNVSCKIASNQSKGSNCVKRMKIKMANYLNKEKSVKKSLMLPDLKFLSKQKSLTGNNDINTLSNPTSSDSDSASSLKLTVNTEDICDLRFNKTYDSFSDKDLIEVEYHVDSILSDEQENV